MFQDQRVAVVMPAYNAEKTLLKTYYEVIDQACVDRVIIVDDGSSDRTAEIAAALPDVCFHRIEKNSGYGANQKVCYRLALEEKADIIIMVHPDYQYTPLLIPAMCSMIGSGLYECVIASRILGGRALADGMPLYKYVSNRFLTGFENLLLGAKLSEYHSGYRAFSRKLLERLPLDRNSDDFVFDNQMLLQILWTGTVIAEVSCPTKYFEEASSINFRRSCRYGLGCLWTGILVWCCRHGIARSELFEPAQRDVLKR